MNGLKKFNLLSFCFLIPSLLVVLPFLLLFSDPCRCKGPIQKPEHFDALWRRLFLFLNDPSIVNRPESLCLQLFLHRELTNAFYYLTVLYKNGTKVEEVKAPDYIVLHGQIYY